MAKTLSDKEISILQSRWAAGYQPAITGLPNQKSYIQAKTTAFIADPSSFIVTDIVNVQMTTQGDNLCGAAFQYLMEGTNGTVIHDHILAQIAESGVDYTQIPLGTGSDYPTFSTWWFNTFYLAYDYTRDLFSDAERASIESWFFDVGVWMLRSINERQFNARIPYRASYAKYDTTIDLVAAQGSHISGKRYYTASTNLNYIYNGVSSGSINDYTATTTVERDYSSIVGIMTDTTINGYTHVDSLGISHNPIRTGNTVYSNRNTMQARALLYIGIELADELMINHAKIFYEELLRFSTYPDGMTSESIRNGGNGYPMLGSLYYQGYLTEFMIDLAWLCYTNGYGNWFTYETSEGHFGTVGGTKNLRLILETEIENMAEEVDRYYSSVSVNNKIDCYNDANDRRWPFEQRLAYANKYYRELRLTNCYMLNLPNQVSYSVGAVSGNNPWGGSALKYASSPFMYELELYPLANAGNDQSIDVAVTTLDGTGSSDLDGTIVSYLWEQVSGPNTANILTPTASTSIVNGMITGDYIFRLTITDNDSLTDTDTVTITVNPVISTTKANARVLL